MISSRGAAVGFPGAKADSTGVTGGDSPVGDGSYLGIEVAVGSVAGVAVQAFTSKRKDTNKHEAKRSFFMRAPQREMGIPSPELNITPASYIVPVRLN